MKTKNFLRLLFKSVAIFLLILSAIIITGWLVFQYLNFIGENRL